jgi:glycosyltransferase involved in cell wall biosynthesis
MKYYKELLTIGIPAYNEAKYIRKTIESCINQAGAVIISDNTSNDETQQICEELVKKYSNLFYIRQKKNIGGTENFNFLLKETKTKYFMWLGGHDYLDQEYTTHMIHMLENSDSVGCYPSCRYVDKEDTQIGIYDCWFANRLVSDYPIERIYALISHLHDVSALFGIYHTKLAKKYLLQPIIGNDHVFLCNMALNGRLIYSARSVYNWRQTKIELSDSENIAAWEKSLGNESVKIDPSRKIMKNKQIAILKKASIKGYGIFYKLYIIFKAKRKLDKRFGE